MRKDHRINLDNNLLNGKGKNINHIQEEEKLTEN